MRLVPPPNANGHRQQIRSEQIRLLFEQLPAALIATTIVGALVVYVLWGHVSPVWLLLWLLGLGVTTVVRAWLMRAYLRAKPSPSQVGWWGRRFLAGVVVSGVIWGLAGVFPLSPDAALQELFLLFVLAGLTAGGMSTLSSFRGAYAAFLVPAILPFAVKLMTQGGEVPVAMSSMLILFIAMMSLISARHYRSVTESLRLRFDNADLVDDLAAARDHQQAINRELEGQMEETQRTEEALRRAYDDLERKVQQRTAQLARANDILRTDKELFRVTLASIGDAVITTDATAVITYLNAVAERLTGWDDQTARGRPLTEVFRILDEVTRDSADDPVDRCLKGNERCRTGQPLPADLPRSARAQYRHVRGIDPEQRQRQHRRRAGVSGRHGGTQARAAVVPSSDPRHPHRPGESTRIRAASFAPARFGKPATLRMPCCISTSISSRWSMTRAVTPPATICCDRLRHSCAPSCAREIRLRGWVVMSSASCSSTALVLEAKRIANSLRELLQGFRFGWTDRSFTIGVSIGLVPITRAGETLAGVFSAADSSCYAAKEKGRNRVHVYQADDSMLAARDGEMRWMPRIQQALADERFRLYFQPILPVGSDAPAGARGEILIRMVDEAGRIVPPGAFLPAAERYGLMLALDRWVVRKSLEALSATSNIGGNVTFAINISGQSLGAADFLDFVTEQIDATRVAPSKLCFEITETSAVSELAHALRFIDTLKGLGCRFALDDFGTGVSSFSYLKTLPVDYLKIDGGFVTGLVGNAVDQAMVEAVHHIGHMMRLETIAEWVESRAILLKLRQIGVDYGQGYALGHPRPLDLHQMRFD